MMYEKFEDIPVWQKSREFVTKVYKITVKNFKNDFSLIDQLKRAAYSIMLNIAEGFERRSNQEFSNFINIAKGSAGEVRSILYIAKDVNYINNGEFEELADNILEISRQLSKFGQYLLASKNKK